MSKKNIPIRSACWGIALSALLIFIQPRAVIAQAQVSNSSAAETGLQEIVVTAQKRQQPEFDVPISLDVLSEQELKNREITNLNTLQYSVPGLWVQSNGPERRINIDGVSNIYGNGPLVGVYLDDADITPDGATANFGYGVLDTRTYDVARVEVLRGPQGTLYGEGSMGGAIHLVSNKPVLDQFQASANIAEELTQAGAPSERIDTMINAPLVENVFAVRLAGEFEHDGGWIDDPAAGIKNFNSQNLVDFRLQALWQATPDFKINLMQIEHRNAYGIGQGEDASGNYTPFFNQTTVPHGEQNFSISNATVAYDFLGMELLSSTTRLALHNDNQTWGALLPIFGVPYIVDYPYFNTTDSSTSEEFRLTRVSQDPWQFTVGYFYKHFYDDVQYGYYFDTPQPVGTPLSGIPFYTGGGDDRHTAQSFFLDTSYLFFNRLTLGAGARYFTDNVRDTPPVQTATFSSTDPRFYVRYGVSEHVNLYASASKGFRSGGFNTQGSPPYQPESVWTYDLGAKVRLLQDRLTINTDIYRSDYSGYTIFGLTAQNPVNVYANGGRTQTKGVNVDVTLRPSAAWLFRLNGGYIHARFVEVNVQDSNFIVGDPVPLVPEYLVTATIERDFQLLEKPAHVRVDYSQLGPSSEVQRSLGEFLYSTPLHTLNLNSGLQWSENVSFSVYFENLTNDRNYVDPTGSIDGSARQRPRTVGIGVEMKTH